jgi:hypothetical protein
MSPECSSYHLKRDEKEVGKLHSGELHIVHIWPDVLKSNEVNKSGMDRACSTHESRAMHKGFGGKSRRK